MDRIDPQITQIFTDFILFISLSADYADYADLSRPRYGILQRRINLRFATTDRIIRINIGLSNGVLIHFQFQVHAFSSKKVVRAMRVTMPPQRASMARGEGGKDEQGVD